MKYANGIYFNQPHPKAPEFILGSISVKPEVFIDWLNEQKVDEKGYVRLKVNTGKQDGKPFVAVDDWKPEKRAEDIDPASIPF